MNRYILLTAFCIVALNFYAQIVTNEEPYGLKADFRAQTQDAVVLTAPNMARIEKEDMVNDQRLGPVRYAYPIQVDYTLENSGVWQKLDDGSKVWRLKVNIPGALSTNTYYDRWSASSSFIGIPMKKKQAFWQLTIVKPRF